MGHVLSFYSCGYFNHAKVMPQFFIQQRLTLILVNHFLLAFFAYPNMNRKVNDYKKYLDKSPE